MTKLIISLALAGAALTAGASPVAAGATCTEQYTKCLNDSWELEGFLQRMADIECGAEYSGCVARKLFF